ncbi:hypothetical protein [Antrihabitans stalactiti]|uniref:Uncharacterized protein n=1 Tax=Antrihabitans stalactiti TaxID=2584121 RepID=A0A848K5B5_9NOCA|nr:hypothetical protein [Antrihabitans stalactiti]NMN93781.1 hypothetical protein [Antrihabitans stalactiti]
MVGTDDLKWIVGEIEHRLQRVIDEVEGSVKTRLTRDLNRAHLYLKAVRSGYEDLIPERLSVDLLQRYKPGHSTAQPEEIEGDESDKREAQ